MTKSTVTSMFGTKIYFDDDRDGQVAMEVPGSHGLLVSASELRAAIDKVDPPKIANQERNRVALIEQIAGQDRIIRRRNEQIARQAKQIENQARNAEEAQWAIEEQDARKYSLAADFAAAVSRAEKAAMERDEYRAMHSEQMKTIARLQENPRPLTAEQEEQIRLGRLVEMIRDGGGAVEVHGVKIAPCDTFGRTRNERAAAARPEGAEELEALIDRAALDGEDADNESLADYLATLVFDPTVKEQS